MMKGFKHSKKSIGLVVVSLLITLSWFLLPACHFHSPIKTDVINHKLIHDIVEKIIVVEEGNHNENVYKRADEPGNLTNSSSSVVPFGESSSPFVGPTSIEPFSSSFESSIGPSTSSEPSFEVSSSSEVASSLLESSSSFISSSSSSSSSFIPSSTSESSTSSSSSSEPSTSSTSSSSSTSESSSTSSSSSSSSSLIPSSTSSSSSSTSSSSSSSFSSTTSESTTTSINQAGQTIIIDLTTTVTQSFSTTTVINPTTSTQDPINNSTSGGLSSKSRNIVIGVVIGVGLPILIILGIFIYWRFFKDNKSKDFFINSEGELISRKQYNKDKKSNVDNGENGISKFEPDDMVDEKMDEDNQHTGFEGDTYVNSYSRTHSRRPSNINY